MSSSSGETSFHPVVNAFFASNQFGAGQISDSVAITFDANIDLIALDMTVLNVAIPTILRDFRTTLSSLQWVITGYSLTFATLPLIPWVVVVAVLLWRKAGAPADAFGSGGGIAPGAD